MHGGRTPMRINIYAHLIIIEILDDIYARAQTWSTVEYLGTTCTSKFSKFSRSTQVLLDLISIIKFPSRPALRFYFSTKYS